jgi:HSP20 family protein
MLINEVTNNSLHRSKTMALVTRRENGNRNLQSRDPFALARELLSWDPFNYSARPVVTFAPAFEVKETEDAFLVRADVPGVKESDLDVSVHNNILSISGARSAEERKEGESYYVYERQYGSFSRSFALPETADAERIEAKLEEGVLALKIGKRVEAKPRKIELRK